MSVPAPALKPPVCSSLAFLPLNWNCAERGRTGCRQVRPPAGFTHRGRAVSPTCLHNFSQCHTPGVL